MGALSPRTIWLIAGAMLFPAGIVLARIHNSELIREVQSRPFSPKGWDGPIIWEPGILLLVMWYGGLLCAVAAIISFVVDWRHKTL